MARDLLLWSVSAGVMNDEKVLLILVDILHHKNDKKWKTLAKMFLDSTIANKTLSELEMGSSNSIAKGRVAWSWWVFWSDRGFRKMQIMPSWNWLWESCQKPQFSWSFSSHLIARFLTSHQWKWKTRNCGEIRCAALRKMLKSSKQVIFSCKKLRIVLCWDCLKFVSAVAHCVVIILSWLFEVSRKMCPLSQKTIRKHFLKSFSWFISLTSFFWWNPIASAQPFLS